MFLRKFIIAVWMTSMGIMIMLTINAMAFVSITGLFNVYIYFIGAVNLLR